MSTERYERQDPTPSDSRTTPGMGTSGSSSMGSSGTPRTTTPGTTGGAGQQAEGVVDQVRVKGQETLDQVKEKGQQAADSIGSTADQGLDRAADTAKGLADTLHGKADMLPGDTAPRLAHQAASNIERGADYLREKDVNDLRGDLETLIRRYPTQSIAVGAAVGFLLARVFR